MEHQLAGWLLFFVNLVLPLLSYRIRTRPSLARAVYVSLAFHQMISLVHVYVASLPMIDADAVRFHHSALTQNHYIPYIAFLGSMYSGLGGSHLLGCQLSNTGFLVALYAFIELVERLGQSEHAPALVLMLSFLPSCALCTSGVLREVWQMGFFLIIVLAALELRQRMVGGWSLAGVLAAVMLVYLHNAFGLVILALVPGCFLWAFREKKSVQALIVVAAILLAPLLAERLAANSRALQTVTEGRFLEYVDTYQEQVNVGRSQFAATLDLSSLEGFLRTGPIVWFSYLFSPFPWELRGFKDVLGSLESFFRIALVLGALVAVRRSAGEERARLFFLFILFLVMETVWAAGTSNWGTAFRHRLVAYPLLVILGGPVLLQWFRGGPGYLNLKARRERRLDRDPALDLDSCEGSRQDR